MTTYEVPAAPAGRLLWALRFHGRALAVVALLTLLLTAVAVGRLVLAPPTYTATAAVIATDLEFSAERVPRLAAAVARQDSVLAEVVRRGRLPWSVDQLRDEHLVVSPIEDNVLTVVEGSAEQPQLAVRTANSTAEALAAALQRSGTEATFSVQERALRAVQDDVLIPVAVTAVAGLAGTAAVVVGAALLLLALRRPVTHPDEATRLTGLAVLTVLEMPRRGRPRWPVSGLLPLRRALDSRGAHTVVLTSTPDGASYRTAAAESYAHLLGLHGDATLVPCGSGRPLPPAMLDASRVVLHDRSEVLPADAGATVVDGFDDERAAWRESLPSGAAGVVVVVEGARQDDVARAVARFAPEDLPGLAFVVRRGSRRRARGAGPARRSRWREQESRAAGTVAATVPVPLVSGREINRPAPDAPVDPVHGSAVEWPRD
jgi:capsular polysaccharide biosynthesis protein